MQELIAAVLKIQANTTLVFPYIDYCYAIYTDITAELDRKLYRAINACLRFVHEVKRDQHITPYYRNSGWLKVICRREYIVSCLIHKIIVTRRPHLLYSSIVFRSSETHRATRAPTDLLVMPQCRTEIYRRSFLSTAARI